MNDVRSLHAGTQRCLPAPLHESSEGHRRPRPARRRWRQTGNSTLLHVPPAAFAVSRYREFPGCSSSSDSAETSPRAALPPCKSCPGSPPPRSQCPPSPGNWGSRRCGPVLREGTPLVRPPARGQRMSRASQQVRPAAPAQHVRSDTGLRPAATTPPGSHRRAAAGAGRGARAVPNLRNTHVLTAMFVPVHLRAEAPLHFSRRHRRRALGLAGHRHSSSDTRST